MANSTPCRDAAASDRSAARDYLADQLREETHIDAQPEFTADVFGVDLQSERVAKLELGRRKQRALVYQ